MNCIQKIYSSKWNSKLINSYLPVISIAGCINKNDIWLSKHVLLTQKYLGTTGKYFLNSGVPLFLSLMANLTKWKVCRCTRTTFILLFYPLLGKEKWLYSYHMYYIYIHVYVRSSHKYMRIPPLPPMLPGCFHFLCHTVAQSPRPHIPLHHMSWYINLWSDLSLYMRSYLLLSLNFSPFPPFSALLSFSLSYLSAHFLPHFASFSFFSFPCLSFILM